MGEVGLPSNPFRKNFNGCGKNCVCYPWVNVMCVCTIHSDNGQYWVLVGTILHSTIRVIISSLLKSSNVWEERKITCLTTSPWLVRRRFLFLIGGDESDRKRMVCRLLPRTWGANQTPLSDDDSSCWHITHTSMHEYMFCWTDTPMHTNTYGFDGLAKKA